MAGRTTVSGKQAGTRVARSSGGPSVSRDVSANALEVVSAPDESSDSRGAIS